MTTVITLLAAAAAAHAYGNEGSWVFGDLTTQAPYGLDPSAFESATSHPNATGSFPIPGYNLSAPADAQSPNGSAVVGWSLAVSVSADVALSGLNVSSVADEHQFVEATILSLSAPGGEPMAFDASWRVCATVYNGLSAPGTSAGQNASALADGTCDAVLPGDCVKELMVGGSTAVDAVGNCKSMGVPGKCEGYFADDVEGTTFALNSTILSAGFNNRFFAYASSPTIKGNASALAEATANVWPVLLAWVHLSSGGQIQASNAYVSCGRAVNPSESGSGGSGSGASTTTASNTGTVGATGTATGSVNPSAASPSVGSYMRAGVVKLLVVVGTVGCLMF